MAEPIFSRVGTTPLYWIDPANPITGFVSTIAGTLGPSPNLSLTWTDAGGTYCFLGAAAADSTTFLTALQAYLKEFWPGGAPRLLWILNPNAPMLNWSVQQIVLTQTSSNPVSWRIAQAVDFPFATYTLTLRAGSLVAPGDGGESGWGFGLIDPAGTSAAQLFTPNGLFASASGTTLLSMGAATAGCWRFRMDAPAGSEAFAQLACGIRFFTPDPSDQYVRTIDFAVLRQPAAAAFSLYATMDPQRPLTPERTALGFFSWTTPGNAVELNSGYATTLGYAVDLTPLAAIDASVPSARLVFGIAPLATDASAPDGYYLTPDGGFAVTVIPPPGGFVSTDIDRFICGASGLEYIGLPSGGGSALTFVAAQPAYAPLATGTTASQSLTAAGTTAWVYARPPTGKKISYYAQPEDAPLFQAPKPPVPPDDTIGLLDFLELIAADLPAPDADHAFPMAPFRNLDAAVLSDALRVEQLALAPTRRATITGILNRAAARAAARPSPAATDDAETIGVTPQGMAVGVAADDKTWAWLGLGQTGPESNKPDLVFTMVKDEFRQAMLTNNLFMVLGNAQEFGTAGSTAYQLTEKLLNVIATLPAGKGVPPDVLSEVRTYFAGQQYPVYSELTLFQGALTTACPTITPAQMLVFQRFAGLLTPVIEGWPFRLSPDNWTNPDRLGQTNAYIIYKFVLGRSLRDLAGDVSTWAWPAAASPTGKPTDAQKDILAILGAEPAPPADSQPAPTLGSVYDHFTRIVDDKNWTGILALSVEVPLDQLPGPLQALAAGIDASAFYAHHIGFSATPFHLVDGVLKFSRTSMFGLIDYENPEDQFFSEDIPFAFRVLQLTIGFENSVITTFASRVQLMVNRLFGAPARLYPTTHGNNVMLVGAYQKQKMPDGSEHDSYVFAMSGFSTFQLDGLVLQSVEVLSTQLLTSKQTDPDADDATVAATFQMTGNLRFYEPDLFDPFCWGETSAEDPVDGYLRFGNLSIGMSFSLGDPAGTTVFKLNDGNLSFDFANSVARPDALVSRFPIRLTGLVAMPDPKLAPPALASADAAAAPAAPQTPADMGYVSATAPLEQSVLSQPWYGLAYTIDLGTLGALAGSAGISLGVLAAWSPGAGGDTPAMYLGVKLPGSKGGLGVNLPLQGIIKLGFRAVEFFTDNTVGQPRTYTLRLRDFAISMLGLSFPPGHNNIILFGNPDQTSGTKVGWYAAYSKDDDEKKDNAAPSRRAIRSARPPLRALPPSLST
jgi:hypothetical protein